MPDRPLLAAGEVLISEVPRSSGGGPMFEPQTVHDAVARITPQVQRIQHQVRELPANMRAAKVIFETTVLPNYVAASHFPDALFSFLDLEVVGSRLSMAPFKRRKSQDPEAPTKTFLLAATDASIDALRFLLAEEPTYKTARTAREQIRQLHDVSLPLLQDVFDPGPAGDGAEMLTWDAVLHPIEVLDNVRREVPENTFTKWRLLVEALGGQVFEQHRNEIGSLTYIPVRLSRDAARTAASFNPLRALRPMADIRPVVSPLRSTVVPPPPPSHTPAPKLSIAIFDTGADTNGNPYTDPFCRVQDLTTEAPTPGEEHGHGVTSAALYGNVRVGQPLRTPPARVDHFRIWPPPPSEDFTKLDWILDQIKAVTEASRYPIVNLSVGPIVCIDHAAVPHRWTAELDRLAWERGTLFVTAAGNNGSSPDPHNRIQVPSDMANGLSVGGSTPRDAQGNWQRAQHSPLGPGRPGASVRPVGLAFGGIAAPDSARFRIFAHAGGLKSTWGTSFSAPSVARQLAELASELPARRRTANNLRAFAVHFADRDRTHTPAEVGHGHFPEQLSDMLDCTADEITVLYEGAIGRDEVQGVPLPPMDVAVKGILKLRWTLVITSPTDPAHPVDYTLADVQVTLRPNAGVFSYKNPATGRPDAIDSRSDPAGFTALTGQGVVMSVNPVSVSSGLERGNEMGRRRAGKWETIKRGERGIRGSSLHRPRIDLSYLERSGGRLIGNGRVEFSLLVTLAGSPGSGIYDRVRTALPQLLPVRQVTPVRVRAVTS